MRIVNRLNNYLFDNEYKIVIKNNYVDIINYDEIIDFSINKVSLKYKNRIITVEGSRLVISKMMDNEVLINGNIDLVRIN